MPGILCFATVDEDQEEQEAASAARILMNTFAYRPERPLANPPRETSTDIALRGRAVRLEFPEELEDTEWSGPVYAILTGEPRNLKPTDPSPFVADDGERCPAWECRIVATARTADASQLTAAQSAYLEETVWIPYWRLTHPHLDLTRELDERPLLTVFRFARITRYFLSSPRNDTKLILQTPGVFVYCQVISYRRAAAVSLVDDIDVIVEPGSAFVCIISLRRHATDDPVIAVVPLADLHGRMIPAEEFMLGYGHGLAASVTPAPFAVGWNQFKTAPLSDSNGTRAALHSSFTAADPVASGTIDIGAVPVPYVSPAGAATSAVPVDFVIALTHPRGAVVDEASSDDDSQLRAPLEGPLISRDDFAITEIAPVPTSTPAAVAPPAAAPPAVAPVAPPVAAPPASAPPPTPAVGTNPATATVVFPTAPPGLTTAEQFLFAMLQEQREENRRRDEATARQFDLVNRQMNQFATAMTNMQTHLERQQLQTQPTLQIADTAAPPGAAVAAIAQGNPDETQPVPVAREQRRHRTGATYDADADDIGRDRHARGRSQDRERSGCSASPDAVRRGRSDRSRSRDRDRARDRDRDPSPPGRRQTGADRYRPLTNDLLVNRAARVRPRTGTDQDINTYYHSDPQDQIRRMLQAEQFRRRYRATKVTAKMLFAVDFHSRELDYFLSDDNQFQGEQRLVTHDASQWNGVEPLPVCQIRTAEDLHRALYAIQDAASVWYPDDVARVFRAVHGNATNVVRHGAPTALITAMCNLYTTVFSSLYTNILAGMDLGDLEREAVQAMNRESTGYRRYVNDVLHDAILNSVLPNQATQPRVPAPRAQALALAAPAGSHRQPHAARPGRGGHAHERGSSQPATSRQAQQTVVPPHIREQVPKYEGRDYCLRHQTLKECDFRGARASTRLRRCHRQSWIGSWGSTVSLSPTIQTVDGTRGVLDSNRIHSPMTVPGTAPSRRQTLVQLPPPPDIHDTTTSRVVYAAFDGGSRSSRSACAWCVWDSTGLLLQWQAMVFVPAKSNNEMEAQGLLHCLRWLRRRHPSAIATVFGDSTVVINMALLKHACRAVHLRPWIAAIRAHGTGLPIISVRHVRREYNGAADALCNWIMDQPPGGSVDVVRGRDWPCPVAYHRPTSPHDTAPLTTGHAVGPSDWRSLWQATWSLVMLDLQDVTPLIAARFDPVVDPGPSHAPVRLPQPRATRLTMARDTASVFDFAPPRSCTIDQVDRYVPGDVFHALRSVARRLGIPFPRLTAFRKPGDGTLVIPVDDVRILDAMVADLSLGISGTLALFRGQTVADQRPNKALRPDLYRRHLPTYPQLELLCAIAHTGVVPTWTSPVGCVGARPVPANYPGAIKGAQVVIHKLLADYYRGRCIIATMATLVAEPGFQSSAFALVPKKDAPLHLDGRIIHDLAAPAGASVNDQTDSSASPDATWDQYASIARRVRDLRRRFPGYAIYALGADIADAFHHVPLHVAHAPAFGGQLPRTPFGIVSGMAVFGWTASPGFFAVLGKAVRHYQRTGASKILGFQEAFWIFQWVDDIVLIEVDIDDRLEQAEKRLRDGVKLVFGSEGWHEGKFTTWSQDFHAVGIDWSIPRETVSIPQRKIDKVHSTVSEAMSKKYISRKRLDSIVGVLRHVISFIPISKPFIQRLVALQLNCARQRTPGIPMSDFLRKDLAWWKELVFENEFAGISMKLFEPHPTTDDCWEVLEENGQTIITSMRLEKRARFTHGSHSKADVVSHALAAVTERWGQELSVQDAWRHITIYCRDRQTEDTIRKMRGESTESQADLRRCAMIQARHRLHFATHRARQTVDRIAQCDRLQEKTDQLKRAAVAESTLGLYTRNFKFWESFCNDFGFPVWIDELPRARQARMVGLFAGLCASEGHNKNKRGNKFQTFDSKMAAVAFAHKSARNARLDYRDPEFELIAQGYKRTNSQVDRKQPMTTSMLLQMRQRVNSSSDEGRLQWNSTILGFFFLDRSSELWGPVTQDKSTGVERTHCVKAHNVIIRSKEGEQISAETPGAHSVEIVYETHKGDRVGQGVTVRHYESEDPRLCPVAAARECLRIRERWMRSGKTLGPYLTSVSKTATIKKDAVATAIKDTAHSMGLKKQDYSAHSLRIGGACALLAAGKSDLVIRLMGRWSSWCFTVYTRLRPGMVRDAARCMIKASTWECPEPTLEPIGGVSSEAISMS